MLSSCIFPENGESSKAYAEIKIGTSEKELVQILKKYKVKYDVSPDKGQYTFLDGFGLCASCRARETIKLSEATKKWLKEKNPPRYVWEDLEKIAKNNDKYYLIIESIEGTK